MSELYVALGLLSLVVAALAWIFRRPLARLMDFLDPDCEVPWCQLPQHPGRWHMDADGEEWWA